MIRTIHLTGIARGLQRGFSWARGGSLALALSLPFAVSPTLPLAETAAAEQPARLSLSEARRLGFALLRAKHPDHARRIALGLLQADATDYAALMILARAETELGRPAQGARAGRLAWQSAQSEDQQFAAAYMVSKSLAARENYGMAQLWLRRAGQAADNERQETAAKKQFRRVQAMNPWSSKLRFSVRPSSNINGGPTTNTFTIGDFVFVDPTAVPLSGLEYGTHASVRREFSGQKGGPRVHLGFAIDDTRYSLSDAARAASPTARAADFAMTRMRLSGGLVLPSGPRASTRIDLSLSRDWRGGDPLADNIALEIGQDRRLSRSRIGYALSVEDRTRLDRAVRSSDTVSLKGYWAAPLPFGTLSIGGSVSDIRSGSAEIAASVASLSLRFVPKGDIFGAVPSIEIARTARDYDRVVYGASTRQDRSTVVTGELFFKDLDYYGFAPTVGAVYSRNKSNVTIFDYEEYGMTFGIRSTF